MAITKIRLNDETFDLGVQPDWEQTNENAPDFIKNKPTISATDFYPVGSIYLTVNDVNPAALFGGTWQRIKDKFLLAAGDTYTPGSQGGTARVILSEAQTPRHRHTITSITTTADGKHTHTFTGTAASAGSHNHTASGTANSAGAHGHKARYEITAVGVGPYHIPSSAGNNWKDKNTWIQNDGAHTHSVSITVNSGGAHTHAVSGTTANSSTHTHTVSGNTDYTAEAQAHENMPPYLTVYVWQRTA